VKRWAIVLLAVCIGLAGVRAGAEQAAVEFHPAINVSEIAHVSPDVARSAMGANPLTGVPTYEWWYGCAPTSGGMLVGYWDGRPGFGNLFDGDASVETPATRAMIASEAHIISGAENGYGKGDWHNSSSYPDHESNPDCIADFMHTVDGGTYGADIAPGLEAYVEWDNPGTAINESYEATALTIEDPYWDGGTFTYADLKVEIDAGRPVLLDMLTLQTFEEETVLYGHTVTAYGYQDDMFTLFPAGGTANITVPGIAVKDTWPTGTTSMSEWLVDTDANGVPESYFKSSIDGVGVEWWPFQTISDTGGYSYIYYWDWMFSEMITLDIVPEPATLAVLLAGSLALLKRRRNCI